MNLLSIDPGVVCCGWAFWRSNELVSCGLSRTKKSRIEDRIRAHSVLVDLLPDILVIETPEIYQQRFLKGDPNDLVDLAMVVGGIVSVASAGMTLKILRPKEYKGQLPKEVTERRMLAKLSDAEKMVLANPRVFGEPDSAPLSLLHNMKDSVFLGLHQLGRL